MPATAPGTPGPDAHAEPLLKTLQALLRDLPGLVSDRVDLLSLELQRAAQALTQIVVLVVVAAILGVTSWLVLWGGIVAALLAAGLGWAGALALVLVVNVGATWLAVVRVRQLLPRLRPSATRRHLLPSPSPRSDHAPAAHPAHERPDIAPASQPAAR